MCCVILACCCCISYIYLFIFTLLLVFLLNGNVVVISLTIRSGWDVCGSFVTHWITESTVLLTRSRQITIMMKEKEMEEEREPLPLATEEMAARGHQTRLYFKNQWETSHSLASRCAPHVARHPHASWRGSKRRRITICVVWRCVWLWMGGCFTEGGDRVEKWA